MAAGSIETAVDAGMAVGMPAGGSGGMVCLCGTPLRAEVSDLRITASSRWDCHHCGRVFCRECGGPVARYGGCDMCTVCGNGMCG